MDVFPTTRWSLLDAARADGDPSAKKKALEQIILRYYGSLRLFILRKGLAGHGEVDDLLQSFIADKILSGDMVDRIEKSRGMFRGFIKRVLHDYAAEQMRRRMAGKRSPGYISSINTVGECSYSTADTPGREFDRDWAKQVIEQAIRQMELECQRNDRGDLWMVFEAKLLKPLFENERAQSYEQIRSQLGTNTNAQAANRLVTCKRMFGRILRDIVSEYTYSEAELEEELKGLFAALSKSRGVVYPCLT